MAVSAQAQDATPTLKDVFKNSFRVGTALAPRQFDETDTRAVALIKSQFNTITPENVLKWEAVHPSPGVFNFTPSDHYVAFGERNGMFVVGHALVWHSQKPQWVFQNADGQPLTRDVLFEHMRDHILTVVGRYKGRIGGCDVVIAAPPWWRIIGEDYIVRAFQFALEADTKAELYYNDYSLLNEAKRKGALELIGKLRAAGAVTHLTLAELKSITAH